MKGEAPKGLKLEVDNAWRVPVHVLTPPPSATKFYDPNRPPSPSPAARPMSPKPGQDRRISISSFSGAGELRGSMLTNGGHRAPSDPLTLRKKDQETLLVGFRSVTDQLAFVLEPPRAVGVAGAVTPDDTEPVTRSLSLFEIRKAGWEEVSKLGPAKEGSGHSDKGKGPATAEVELPQDAVRAVPIRLHALVRDFEALIIVPSLLDCARLIQQLETDTKEREAWYETTQEATPRRKFWPPTKTTKFQFSALILRPELLLAPSETLLVLPHGTTTPIPYSIEDYELVSPDGVPLRCFEHYSTRASNERLNPYLLAVVGAARIKRWREDGGEGGGKGVRLSAPVLRHHEAVLKLAKAIYTPPKYETDPPKPKIEEKVQVRVNGVVQEVEDDEEEAEDEVEEAMAQEVGEEAVETEGVNVGQAEEEEEETPVVPPPDYEAKASGSGSDTASRISAEMESLRDLIMRKAEVALSSRSHSGR